MGIVVDQRYFTHQDAALAPEFMVAALRQGDAFARLPGAGRRPARQVCWTPSTETCTWLLSVQAFLGCGVIKLDYQLPAAAVDDVFHLAPVEVHGGDLPIFARS